MRASAVLTRCVDALERAHAVDGAAARLNALVRKLVRPGPMEDLLSGTPAGHPLHPAMVAVPIGAWTGSVVLDAVGEDRAARRMIGLGLVASVPAVATGASDWLSVDGAERRVGLVHAALNYSAIAAFAASWFARRGASRGAGRLWSAGGVLALGAAGFLGGHLSYAQGVGVDTTAFQRFPAEWTSVDGLPGIPVDGQMCGGETDGVPVLVYRHSGRLQAMADRCTHRGGPLHEGELRDGCVRCPWHDSAFDLGDGAVRSGPATRPQPMLEVREHDGAVQVRRSQEERALRLNPIGR